MSHYRRPSRPPSVTVRKSRRAKVRGRLDAGAHLQRLVQKREGLVEEVRGAGGKGGVAGWWEGEAEQMTGMVTCA